MKNSLQLSLVLAGACLGGASGCAQKPTADAPAEEARSTETADTTESPAAAETTAAPAPAEPRQLAARTAARSEARGEARNAATPAAAVRKASVSTSKPAAAGATHARAQSTATRIASGTGRPAARVGRPANITGASHAGDAGEADEAHRVTGANPATGPSASINRTPAQVSRLGAATPNVSAATMHGEGEADESAQVEE